MQRFIRARYATLLFAFLFPFFSLVSTYAGVSTPTPLVNPPKVPTRISPTSISTPRVAARSVTQQYKVFLPLILNGAAVKPLPKTKTGIHLGNRDSDWTFDPMDPTTMLNPFYDNPQYPNPNGTWPNVIVVQSRQVFSITRDLDCRITGVGVKNWNAYTLLSHAARYNGTKIILRITPSPGNFEQAVNAGWRDARPRTLITDTFPNYRQTPGNYTQCDPEDPQSTYFEEQFRSVADIGDEMIAIQLWLSNLYYSWQVWGFEPANEPNIEWYRPSWKSNYTEPKEDQRQAWQDMDDYFRNLYDYVTFELRDHYPNLYMRILTPPMAMLSYAEKRDVRYPCDFFQLLDENDIPIVDANGIPNLQGYQAMSQTFDSWYPSNDGYSWHNYFIQGKETWASCPSGQHVSWYFPSKMYIQLNGGGRTGVITEADLDSVGHGMGDPITNKDANPTDTANSINLFVAQEPYAQAIAVWLLNDNFLNDDTYPEHIWHEAYNTDSNPPGFRNWFWTWWLTSQ